MCRTETEAARLVVIHLLMMNVLCNYINNELPSYLRAWLQALSPVRGNHHVGEVYFLRAPSEANGTLEHVGWVHIGEYSIGSDHRLSLSGTCITTNRSVARRYI